MEPPRPVPPLMDVQCCQRHKTELQDIEAHYAIYLSICQRSIANLSTTVQEVKKIEEQIDQIHTEVTKIISIFKQVVSCCEGEP